MIPICCYLRTQGLYWSKIEGTSGAKTIEPSKDYIIPFEKEELL